MDQTHHELRPDIYRNFVRHRNLQYFSYRKQTVDLSDKTKFRFGGSIKKKKE